MQLLCILSLYYGIEINTHQEHGHQIQHCRRHRYRRYRKKFSGNQLIISNRKCQKRFQRPPLLLSCCRVHGRIKCPHQDTCHHQHWQHHAQQPSDPLLICRLVIKCHRDRLQEHFRVLDAKCRQNLPACLFFIYFQLVRYHVRRCLGGRL